MEPTRISNRFCASDSDLTIASSDGVLFKVHHKNLEVHSDVFANAEGATRPQNGAPDEIVYLSESADVLELLFQYMYRQPQPDLRDVEFGVFAGLAEAAEKYVVYSALGWCRMRMKESTTTHPLQVLDYAVKHGHVDLANESAQQSMLSSACGVAEAMDSLAPSTFKKWVRIPPSSSPYWLIQPFVPYTCRSSSKNASPKKSSSSSASWSGTQKTSPSSKSVSPRMIGMRFIAEDTNCESKDVDI
ncbi:hypothetical protein B0H16DRAFT_851181 [Mycena metata]|uniref:BTB domain-containing protein n=1 Tax=Mycena metata TaxID=1033252 RepID=A0AAD7IJY0_9AGAR|nr:hypothetical protein B0H16DRAFT_987011 [Mycena metata]KAJ7750522.1 hypothetical protein B0H16DRAFT_851181 [Mycena metata]